MTARRAAVAWLWAQAGLTVAFWALLVAVPSTRAGLAPPEHPEILMAFWPGDALLVCGAALAAALLAQRGAAAAAACAWLACGGLTYATLYCLGLVLHAGGPWLPVVAMAPACVLTALAARALR